MRRINYTGRLIKCVYDGVCGVPLHFSLTYPSIIVKIKYLRCSYSCAIFILQIIFRKFLERRREEEDNVAQMEEEEREV